MKIIFKTSFVLLIAGSFFLVMVGCGGGTSPAEDVYSPAEQVYSDE